MKKILSIVLTFCAFIAAMACGGNDPEVDRTTGATEQTGGEGEGTAKKLHGTHTVDYAEQIGLGSKKYELISIDK